MSDACPGFGVSHIVRIAKKDQVRRLHSISIAVLSGKACPGSSHQ
jgi:hypothetical protein